MKKLKYGGVSQKNTQGGHTKLKRCGGGGGSQEKSMCWGLEKICGVRGHKNMQEGRRKNLNMCGAGVGEKICGGWSTIFSI